MRRCPVGEWQFHRDETAMLNRIERHVTCAMFTLGPPTPRSLPYYLLSLTLRDGGAITVAATTRLDALRQAMDALDRQSKEAA